MRRLVCCEARVIDDRRIPAYHRNTVARPDHLAFATIMKYGVIELPILTRWMTAIFSGIGVLTIAAL